MPSHVDHVFFYRFLFGFFNCLFHFNFILFFIFVFFKIKINYKQLNEYVFRFVNNKERKQNEFHENRFVRMKIVTHFWTGQDELAKSVAGSNVVCM